MDQASTHHVGMKITIHPGKQTEVEMHHMPIQGPTAGSGAPPQGMVSDPLAEGAKNAMDAALAPSAPAAAGGANSPAGQTKAFTSQGGSETARSVAKKAASTAGKPPVNKAKAPAAKSGVMPKKSSEKDKAKKP